MKFYTYISNFIPISSILFDFFKDIHTDIQTKPFVYKIGECPLLEPGSIFSQYAKRQLNTQTKLKV